jgi:hypothetical protein
VQSALLVAGRTPWIAALLGCVPFVRTARARMARLDKPHVLDAGYGTRILDLAEWELR